VIALAVLAAAELVLIAFLISENRRLSVNFIALTDRLCQRLQAPAAAVLEHDEVVRARRDEEYAPPAIEPDDDDSYWESRDRLAETLMKAEVDDRASA
jgi:hypothetical protein